MVLSVYVFIDSIVPMSVEPLNNLVETALFPVDLYTPFKLATTNILLLVEVGVIVAAIPVSTYDCDVVVTLPEFGLLKLTTCNTEPVAACILSMPVAPVIVVVICYSYGLGLADFTAARRACKSVKVSPPSKRAWMQS